ncbi:MAG: cobalamin biosynthesis protein [Oscillospiraceae bacterium]|nr:cobalamin biosynthesis protein [Oscillospiraceae bacterium]
MYQGRLFSVDVILVICLASAWLIEIVLGSPRFLPKPSRFVERFVKASADRVLALVERVSGTGATSKAPPECDAVAPRPSGRWAGVFLAFYLVSFSFIVTAALIDLAHRLHPAYYYLANILVFYRALNTRAAADKAAVARRGLRGPEDGDGVHNIIAQLSKNCLDGVCAPMLYVSVGMLFGVPAALAAAYGALSILVGVVGDKNSEYDGIGWAAAKLDGAANFLPARLCGIILPLLAPFCGMGVGGMVRGFRATREPHSVREYSKNYTSPNDAWPAAAFAGVLGIKFGRDGYDYSADAAGNGTKAPGMKDIGKAAGLMLASSLATLAACCGALLFYAISG